MKLYIIQFTGRKGSGKSYQSSFVANKFRTDYGFYTFQIAFAQKLKNDLRQIGIVKDRLLYNPETIVLNYLNLCSKISPNDPNLKEEIYSLYYKSKDSIQLIRYIMQHYGTEVLRNRVDKNIHVKYMVHFVNSVLNSDLRNITEEIVIVNDDYRFPNEDLKIHLPKINSDYVNILQIRLKSPNQDNDQHESEKYIDQLNVDIEVDEVYPDPNKIFNIVFDWIQGVCE